MEKLKLLNNQFEFSFKKPLMLNETIFCNPRNPKRKRIKKKTVDIKTKM